LQGEDGHADLILDCDLDVGAGLAATASRDTTLKVGGRISVADLEPDPQDPHVFWTPGTGSISTRCGSGSFYLQTKIVRKTLIPIGTVLFCAFFITFYL
jgi:hypothetical protein